MLAGLLIVGAIVLVATNYKEVREINMFALVLVVQSLPFLAAVGLAVLERTRLNDFAYWRSARGRVSTARCCRSLRRKRRRWPKAARSRVPLHKNARRTRPVVGPLLGARSAVSTSRTQYDVPTGITSSLKL